MTWRIEGKPWTSKQAIVLAVVCLAAGITGGWLIRGSQSSAQGALVQAKTLAATAQATPSPAQGLAPVSAAVQEPDKARLKQIADAQAGQLLDQLKKDPTNPGLLTQIGNLYYDAQAYPTAVDYYGRALQGAPSDAAVRTDMATAYWYMGDAGKALAEFDKALTYAPNNPNTLFNRGLVRWRGKMDASGAIADWELLLKTNPTYSGRDKVEQMLAEARQHGSGSGGGAGTLAQSQK